MRHRERSARPSSTPMLTRCLRMQVSVGMALGYRPKNHEFRRNVIRAHGRNGRPRWTPPRKGGSRALQNTQPAIEHRASGFRRWNATGAPRPVISPTCGRRIAADELNFRAARRQQMQRRVDALQSASAKIPISSSATPFNYTATSRCLNRAAEKHAPIFLLPNNTPRAPQSLRTRVTIAEKIRPRNKRQKEPHTGRN